MSIESMMPSNHLISSRPLLLPPSIFPIIRVFSNELVFRIRWPKYWSLSFSISLSNEYSELISFRMDLLDLLAVQGTLKSLLQHHSSKASILWHSAVFYVVLSESSTISSIMGLWCKAWYLHSLISSSLKNYVMSPSKWKPLSVLFSPKVLSFSPFHIFIHVSSKLYLPLLFSYHFSSSLFSVFIER